MRSFREYYNEGFSSALAKVASGAARIGKGLVGDAVRKAMPATTKLVQHAKGRKDEPSAQYKSDISKPTMDLILKELAKEGFIVLPEDIKFNSTNTGGVMSVHQFNANEPDNLGSRYKDKLTFTFSNNVFQIVNYPVK